MRPVSASRYCGPRFSYTLYASASSRGVNVSRALGRTTTPIAVPSLTNHPRERHSQRHHERCDQQNVMRKRITLLSPILPALVGLTLLGIDAIAAFPRSSSFSPSSAAKAKPAYLLLLRRVWPVAL